MSNPNETTEERATSLIEKLDELADKLIERLQRAKSYEDPFEKTIALAGVLTIASLRKDFYIEMGDLASRHLTYEQIDAIANYTVLGGKDE